MSSSSNIKVNGSLLGFSKTFCEDNGVDLSGSNITLSNTISEDKWYDFELFMNIMEEIKSQKNVLFIEKLGKAFFDYINEDSDSFEDIVKLKSAINKMYKTYQSFIQAERTGIWKTEEVSRSAFLRVKESTPLPADFTKGILYSLAKSIGCKAVSVKVTQEIGDSKESINVYEISWMDTLHKSGI